MEIQVQRFKPLGDGVYKDLKTGKYIDEEIREEQKKEDKARVIGTYYPHKQ